MDYNERNGSYSDDELLSRFSRPETPRTTVQDDIPDDPAALRRDRGPRPGIRMASGRPMRGKKQGPAGRKSGLNYRAALCGAVLAFFVIALLRVFSTPLRLVLKLLVNTLLGFAALWVVHLTAGFTGITLGLNLWNALVVAILGVPGFVLLLLIQWVL